MTRDKVKEKFEKHFIEAEQHGWPLIARCYIKLLIFLMSVAYINSWNESKYTFLDIWLFLDIGTSVFHLFLWVAWYLEDYFQNNARIAWFVNYAI